MNISRKFIFLQALILFASGAFAAGEPELETLRQQIADQQTQMLQQSRQMEVLTRRLTALESHYSREPRESSELSDTSFPHAAQTTAATASAESDKAIDQKRKGLRTGKEAQVVEDPAYMSAFSLFEQPIDATAELVIEGSMTGPSKTVDASFWSINE